MRAKLIIIEGANPGADFTLNYPQIRIGRSVDSEIILNDKTVSRVHAVISQSENGWEIRDNDSQNGTFVGDERIEEAPLDDGDEIKIGATVFQFQLIKEKGARNLFGGKGKSGDLGEKWGNADQKRKGLLPSRPVLITFFLICIVLAPLFIWKEFIVKPEVDAKPLLLPYQFSVGYMPKGDQGHRNHAELIFSAETEDLELWFKVWDVDDEDELDILLNGEKIADVETTGSGNWSGERHIRLPSGLINVGRDNSVVFDNYYNPPKSQFWGVSDIRVVPVTAFECNTEAAQDAYEVGKALFDSYKIRPRNLFDSMKKLEASLNYMKNCGDKPPFYIEVQELHQEVKSKLDTEIKNLFFTAAKNRHLKRFDEAETALLKIMAMIPSPNSEEYVRANRELIRLRGTMRKSRKKGGSSVLP